MLRQRCKRLQHPCVLGVHGAILRAKCCVAAPDINVERTDVRFAVKTTRLTVLKTHVRNTDSCRIASQRSRSLTRTSITIYTRPTIHQLSRKA